MNILRSWTAGVIVAIVFAQTGSARANDPMAPIAKWSFQDAQLPGKVVGKATVVAGATKPTYPTFDAKNKALQLKAPAYLRLQDDKSGRFDFRNGDTITIEAWVKPDKFTENMYVIGKGRSERSGTKSINQNWALRLRTFKGKHCLSFLFHSRNEKATPGAWHRWTSNDGIVKASRWHHVAVSYEFGKPKSIRGYVDGRQVNGQWDMGGATTREPIVDDDDVLIGSAMNGNVGNSFHGDLDEVAVYRRAVAPGELKSRFAWNPPKPTVPSVPDGKVIVEFFGPASTIAQFPEYTEAPLFHYQMDTLAFAGLPHRYISGGIRDDWPKPVLLRAWTNVELTAGRYEFLIRSRGLARLLIDDKEMVRTTAQKSRGSAHNVVDDLPAVARKGMRPAWMNDKERIVSFESPGGRHQVRFEMIVGGPGYRVEVGEPCVAISSAGNMFTLLSSSGDHLFDLTDAGWSAFSDVQRKMLRQLDDRNRRRALQERTAYWKKRHERARQRLVSNSPTSGIDAIISANVSRLNKRVSAQLAKVDAEKTAYYTSKVLPVLSGHCGRCHNRKRQSGLSVLDRESLLRGGESETPAVVPGKPQESNLLTMISAGVDEGRMPPKGDGLSQIEIGIITKWIADGAHMPPSKPNVVRPTELVDDLTFLRRVFVDTVGVPPTLAEIRQFVDDPSGGKREAVVQRLLKDDRWADNWAGYWQDALAENPNLLKPTLNNTGPFRWWIHEALLDNKPVDQFASELMMMRGSRWGGGPAGFGVASQNDVPMAAKAHVVGSAFLGVNMKCARCHDAPYHQWKQSDLFQLAAMLNRQPIKLPTTSTVPAGFFQGQTRRPLIDATLRAGHVSPTKWPFETIDSSAESDLLEDPDDARERLAVRVTTSRRFAEVIVNRVWKRLMGTGMVEPVDDWESRAPSNPQLLRYLTDQLIRNDYNLKALAREIFLSEAYQRQAIDAPPSTRRHFAAPHRRRMTAEQIVDSAFHVVGQRMSTEPLTMDIEGTFTADRFLNFGRPQRAWEFTTLANERDRPSLALPRAQAVVDVLKAFGWRNSRPEPLAHRDETPNLIQPGVLANGTLGTHLVRLTDASPLTASALAADTPQQWIKDLYLRILTRQPTREEFNVCMKLLSPGFEKRQVPNAQNLPVTTSKRFRYVSWSNHLNTEANKIKIELQTLTRLGPPPTRYLTSDWRSRAEDVVWAVLNSPEMVIVP